MLQADLVGLCVISLTTFYKPSSSDSLIIAIELKAKYINGEVATLFHIPQEFVT
jgi:hypothetical protein